MKRSEMQVIISKKIVDFYNCIQNDKISSAMEISDILLDELGYRGMLPPFNDSEGYSTAALAEFYEWEIEE